MKKKIYCLLLIILSLFLLYKSYNYLFSRIFYMLENKCLIAFYETIELENRFNDIINSINNYFSNFFPNIKSFFIWLFKILISPNALIIYSYILQLIVIIKLMLAFWVSGKNLSFKTSKFTKLINYIYIKIRYFVIDYKKFLIKNKNKCFWLFILLSGTFEIFIFELILFLIKYLISIFNLTSYVVVFNLFKWLIINIVNFFMFSHPIIIILVLLIIYIFVAVLMGKKKLKNNWVSFKRFVADSESANIIFGAPGTGKTSTAVNAQFAQTEIYYDNYVNSLIDFEISHPEINFSYIRLIAKIYFMDFTENEIDYILKQNKKIIIDIVDVLPYLNDEVLRCIFNMYYRGSCILSGVPVKDPYTKFSNTNGYSRKLDFNTLKFYEKKDKLPFEDDTTCLFDEFDKEWNSHTSQSDVNKSGVHVFFSYVRHLGTKAWLTCQGLGQGLKNIKVCAGKFYYLYDKEIKMPLMIGRIYKIISYIDYKLSSILYDYLGERQKTGKWTFRRSSFKYKRNNVSLLYQLLKYCCCLTHYICNYLQNYYYYKIYAEVSFDPDLKEKKKVSYKINFCDFYDNDDVVYNSRQFKAFYDDFKENLQNETNEFQSIQLFEAWTSLDPTMEEYNNTNQSTIKKIYDSQFKE